MGILSMVFFNFLNYVVYFVTLYKLSPIIFVHIFVYAVTILKPTRNQILLHLLLSSDKCPNLVYNGI